MMHIHVLGTAAYEGIPSLFCRCSLCQEARKRGGKDIRTRTSVLIDGELKIDFPPDTLHHMLRDGLDLENVKDLLITHSHSDHLYAEDLVARLPGYAQAADHAIHIYAHDVPLLRIHTMMQEYGAGWNEKYQLHRIQPFQRFGTQTAEVVPLPANHQRYETSLIYYMEKNGQAFLHGHDSGRFPQETLDWLQGNRLDGVLLECTSGNLPHCSTHMNAAVVLETKAWMKQHGVIQAGTPFVVSHFSHNAGMTHDDLCAHFEPHGIQVAYDGMTFQI